MHARSDPVLDHLDLLTDSTGLIQHGIYSIPRRDSGYTTDDNARALRLCARLWNADSDDRMLDRVACYLSFLEYARRPTGGFHNFMNYERKWLDAVGTDDSQGQAILALAEVLASSLPRGFRDLARELIDGALPVIAGIRSLRAEAHLIQAWAVLWRSHIADIGALEELARQSADRLVNCYHHSQHSDWRWFESRLTYANAVLPHALFDAAERWPDEEFMPIAETSFGFLDDLTTADDVFWPVGNLDWYARGEDKSLYDQQPLEASTMAAAALTALELRHDQSYLMVFQKAYGWFHGRNSLNSPIADSQTGACFDGLKSNGVNRNQGAESTLAYLWTELLARNVQDALLPARDSSGVAVPQFLRLHE